MNKWINEYVIPFMVVIGVSAVLLYIPYSSARVNTKEETKEICNKVQEENKNNVLVAKNDFNEISYYLYDENQSYKSYFLNTEENTITDVYSIIKEEKVDAFNNKINELLNLKYPKFVVDAINTSSSKNYKILDNEMIIYYTDVDIHLEEQLYLTVNYNEIKDCLNITFKLDKEYENENGYNYDPNKKTVALTFDDGPGGNNTLELVDILKENKAHATFFMLGNRMKSYQTVVATVHNSGNEIGSHTYNHCNLNKSKLETILENEQLTNDIYYELTQDTIKLTRPPYGNLNEEVKNALDTVFVTWSIDTEDWRYKDVEHIKSEILNKATDGDIILLHDIYKTSVEAIREVLPLLYEEGYQVVSVSELANLKGRTLEKNNIYRKID